MQCDLFHPHQILADLLTIIEKKGDPAGPDDHHQLGVRGQLPEADQRPHGPDSMLTTRFGMNVRLVHPPEFKLRPTSSTRRAENARRSGGSARADGRLRRRDRGLRRRLRQELGRHCSSPRTTRTAPDRRTKYTDWITDERRMALAADDAIYMHPLAGRPQRRGRRRGHRRSALGRLRRGREPAPCPEGGDGPDDALRPAHPYDGPVRRSASPGRTM